VSGGVYNNEGMRKFQIIKEFFFYVKLIFIFKNINNIGSNFNFVKK
jgi:hypothetical protein